ncbi:hypothetical protein CDD81_7816 [Ophiocordyceps australis]|uniref:Zn(2)-C6 fungal-type domain-containing protein n=1 Tax=Ophiocordyceps australis TaxID=1399860 RepID=A0A2C5YF37_9HYPO|nr:hypothetical protein CDD81_7816 [Ophiocordyceps australis]
MDAVARPSEAIDSVFCTSTTPTSTPPQLYTWVRPPPPLARSSSSSPLHLDSAVLAAKQPRQWSPAGFAAVNLDTIRSAPRTSSPVASIVSSSASSSPVIANLNCSPGAYTYATSNPASYCDALDKHAAAPTGPPTPAGGDSPLSCTSSSSNLITSASSAPVALPTPPSSAPSCSASLSQSISPPSNKSTKKAASSKSAAAMPGRSASNKRPVDTDDDGASTVSASGSGRLTKLPRTDRGPEDFSSVVKNRLQSYTRTGQACDRCKVRKIRCDALPEGCSHCINLNLECFVTDRVTGRTERRGYMQELEREKNGMLAHISDMEKLLQDKGLEVKSWKDAPEASGQHWSRFGSLWVKGHDLVGSTAPAVVRSEEQPLQNCLRSRWDSKPDQNCSDAAPENSPVTSMEGTRLSLLGSTIDTTSFEDPDVDEPPADSPSNVPLYNKSVQAFLHSSMGVNPKIHVDLPSHEEAVTYSNYYFMSVGIFLPVLHKPSYMQLLARMYDEPNFRPSVSEQVMVHMVLGIIYLHCGVRNWQQTDQRAKLNDLSNKHYHFALSKMHDLLVCPDLEALQALALIASHTRCFPKPACGAIVSRMALNRAVELNLHRATNKPIASTDLHNELRKRTWWTLLTIVISIHGKRGCPLPVGVQDFDTEIPEPIADELLSEQGVDTSQSVPCHFRAGVAAFKVLPLFMEMYSNVYSVRRNSENYTNVVNAVEEQLRRWEADLPEALGLGRPDGLDATSAIAVYTRTLGLELRLYLRHPSVAATSNEKMLADNTRICEETAGEFLRMMRIMQRLKALDTTWYQMSVYAVCIFSMLMAHWERRYSTTPEKVAALKEDMDSWMDIVKETCLLLGCGHGMSSQLDQIIERIIGWIEHDMRRERVPEPAASVPAPEEKVKREEAPNAAAAYSSTPNGLPRSEEVREGPAKVYFQDAVLDGSSTYPTMAYAGQATNNTAPAATAAATYQTEPAIFYSTTDPAASNAVAPPPPPPPPTSTSNAMSAAAVAAFTNPQPDMMWQTNHGNTWHDWTAAIADCQERFSASALLALGGTARPSMGESEMMQPGAQWPLILFDHTTQ